MTESDDTIREGIEARRCDPDYMARLARRLDEDRPVLELLAGGGAVGDAELGRVEKPWGYELRWALTEHYAGKILFIKAGHALSLQMHREKDESSYLLAGRLTAWAGATEEELDTREVVPGYSWRTRPGTIHAIEALEDSVVLEVSTPQLEDVVRLRDRYGRADDGS